MRVEFFKLNQGTIIDVSHMVINKPVQKAIDRMKRDMHKVLSGNQIQSVIKLEKMDMDAEAYEICFEKANSFAIKDEKSIESDRGIDSKATKENSIYDLVIRANDDLGFIFAMNYISEQYLDIKPFWFWNDQDSLSKECVLIPITTVKAPKYAVKYRGWFVNDEVLLSTWKINGDNTVVWEMVFEALLRLGGNTVIPGTDKNAHLNKQLASDMGLWISHHHAEPLGAEMFGRVHPESEAIFSKHPDKFRELWRQGVRSQKDMKVIWNLGFRGQGDCPFWATDNQYKTPESRGLLISQIMEEQAAIVREYVSEPVFCTNLYGEIMELYTQGHIRIPDNTIRVRADNGYGKMVSRRQELYNPRVLSVPSEQDKKAGEQEGIYYHVSFYDLQAANHITMLPNSVEFVRDELTMAFNAGADDFLIVNCSNVKPHVYFLEAISYLWKDGILEAEAFKKHYIKNYYLNEMNVSDKSLEQMVGYFDKYAKATVDFGDWEDEHAGEQLYTYTTRAFYSSWMQGQTVEPVVSLTWATGDSSFKEQIDWYLKKCESGLERFLELKLECEKVDDILGGSLLWQDSMMLQVNIHFLCLEGSVSFCKGYLAFAEGNYKKAFYLIGKSSQYFQQADDTLCSREHGKWKGFYANECLSDIKLSATLLKNLMGYIRNIGEGPHFYSWQRELLYSAVDCKVMLITNFENHATDQELFEYMDERC